MSIDADTLKRRLDAHDHRRILKRCGFEINGQSGPKLSGVLGPKALGEGESGNFSVNLRDGFVKDWGSSGYKGDVFNVVMDVHGLPFPEALEWIVDELNLDVDSESRSNGQSNGASSPPANRPSNEKSEPEPVATHEEVRRWHERLMSDTDAAQAARSYLTGKRGVAEGVLRAARIGLAHSPDDYRASWWIMIPVPHRSGGDPPPIVAVKGFAFNPAAVDWKRDDDGDKIPRNAGSAALYDLVPPDPKDGPVVVCEGELDALSALSHGFNAVTGTSGAGTFRGEWAACLARLIPAQDHGVVVAFDGDEEGRKWAPKHAETLHEAGLDVRVAALPDGQDVNDVLVSGGSADLHAYLAQADPYTPAENDSEEERQTAEYELKKLRRALRSEGIDPQELIDGEADADAPPEGSEASSGLEAASPLPDVYGDLPDLLQEAASTFGERHERDVFLTAALPSIGACMPKVRGYYGHVPEPLTPHTYAAIVAGAAGGKSPAKWGRKLARKVDEQIKEKSQKTREEWQARKEAHEADEETDEPFSEPKPPKKSLFLPANASAAAFHDGLKDRGERALVVETEIDTLTNALGQEWGKFDDTLRKAYHHEPTSYRRKGEGSVELDAPRLSVVLSGTPRQFAELMGSSESGLYSRFALYYFEAPPVWISQKPTEEALDKIDRFDEYAGLVAEIYRGLASREDPLRFRLTDAQWELHELVLRNLLHEAAQEGRGHMSDVYKRAGVQAFRIAMTLTVLRAVENEVPLHMADELEAERCDVETALDLAVTYADHAVRFAEERLDEVEPVDPQSHRIAVILRGVDAEFSSGDAYELAAAEGIGVSKRTLRKDLKKAADRGLVRATGANGQWRKIGPEGTSDASDASDPTEIS